MSALAPAHAALGAVTPFSVPAAPSGARADRLPRAFHDELFVAVPSSLGWDAAIPHKSFWLYLFLAQAADAQTGDGSVTHDQIGAWLQYRGKQRGARVARWLHPLIAYGYIALRAFDGETVRYRV